MYVYGGSEVEKHAKHALLRRMISILTGLREEQEARRVTEEHGALSEGTYGNPHCETRLQLYDAAVGSRYGKRRDEATPEGLYKNIVVPVTSDQVQSAQIKTTAKLQREYRTDAASCPAFHQFQCQAADLAR